MITSEDQSSTLRMFRNKKSKKTKSYDRYPLKYLPPYNPPPLSPTHRMRRVVARARSQTKREDAECSCPRSGQAFVYNRVHWRGTMKTHVTCDARATPGGPPCVSPAPLHPSGRYHSDMPNSLPAEQFCRSMPPLLVVS